MYLKLDESKWYRHSHEWYDFSKREGKTDVWHGQIEVAEDVAPVIHAHWVEAENGILTCSACWNGWDCQPTICGNPAFEFCPVCGARMDEVAE